MAKFTSEAHSLIFYADESGTEKPVFFDAHQYETDDRDVVEALTSDRAKASGIVAVEGGESETPAPSGDGSAEGTTENPS